MKALIGCERSGAVRRALRNLGWDAWSCDIVPADDGSEFHIRGDVLGAIEQGGWTLGIFFPPCTYLCSSGMHWTRRGLRDPQLTEHAVAFVKALLNAPIPHIALENPIGILSTRIRKPDQIIQPYQFGHDASKQTCLWLQALPKLTPTKYIEPRIVNGKKRWGNQTDSGQNKLPPSEKRAAMRSETYAGVAEAMANQWTNYIQNT